MSPETISRLEELERFLSDMVDFEEFTTEAVAEALKELARFPEVFSRAIDVSVGNALQEVGDNIFGAEALARVGLHLDPLFFLDDIMTPAEIESPPPTENDSAADRDQAPASASD